MLKLAFAERLAYTRNEGFRTAVPALPFKVLADMKSGKSKMARPEGAPSNDSLDTDSLFATLQDWNTELERLEAPLPGREPTP